MSWSHMELAHTFAVNSVLGGAVIVNPIGFRHRVQVGLLIRLSVLHRSVNVLCCCASSFCSFQFFLLLTAILVAVNLCLP